MNERPTHLDLFSGIGGFALAAQWAGFRTVGFVEREPFCQKVLSRHFPDRPIFGDIAEFSATQFAGIDLLTGGFPCQPFSQAGRRKGKDDDRYLWPEMFRVIQEARPTWIVGENVAGLDGLGLDDCISDLESISYKVAPPLEIPACAVGTPHKRERVWILAYSTCDRQPQPRLEDWKGASQSFPPATWAWPERPSAFTDIPRATDGVSNRMDRLTSLGNAIVPQVAYQILKEIRKLI